MAGKKSWHIVSYDVRDPKRLKKVAKHLEGYGIRLQHSVFRCQLGDRQRERLLWELKRMMEPEDSLIVIALCNHCINRMRKTNTGSSWPEDPPTFEIV